MDDLISRQAAIDYCESLMNVERLQKTDGWGYGRERYNQAERIMQYIENMPSAERDYKFDEWCTDCKEYDQERHCCPRFNHVIRTTLQEVQEERKKGAWIRIKEPISNKWRVVCSDCNAMSEILTRFCPNCGAEMRERKDG